MSSPTTIRYAASKDEIYIVTTYFDKSGLGSGRFLSVFQVYNVYDTGRTVLTLSQVYMTEAGAIAEWQSHVAGLVA